MVSAVFDVVRWLCHRILEILGWTFAGDVPDIPKMVIIGAPHTTNWDFILFLGALYHWDLEVRFLAKHTLFRWPLGAVFTALGGIPVDSAGAGGVVRQVQQTFESEERMVLVIAPEGTRMAAPVWKTGFIEIAERTGVPVVPAGVDYPTRTITIGSPLDPSTARGDLMDQLREFYADKEGMRQDFKGPVRLAGESDGL